MNDFDPFYSAPKQQQSEVILESSDSSNRSKTSKESQFERIDFLFTAGEINCDEKEWLRSQVKNSDKKVKTALREAARGNIESLSTLLHQFNNSCDEDDDSSCCSSDIDEDIKQNEKDAQSNKEISDIPSWDPSDNKISVPPSLLRLRGKDLCGDIKMRIRSKVIRRKWKSRFFQVHGDSIATYRTTDDWLNSTKPYWLTRMKQSHGITGIKMKVYQGYALPCV